MKRFRAKSLSITKSGLIIMAAVVSVLVLSACSSSICNSINQETVDEFYKKASNAEIKYGEEPMPGVLRPFPASFVLAGKILLIETPAFDENIPTLPVDVYEKYNFNKYSWYTSEPDEVQYIVLLETFHSPDEECGLGNTLIFTIIDLSYNEKVYKSYIGCAPNETTPPYEMLAELLEALVL